MAPTDAPNHRDIASQLPAGTYYYLVYSLRQTLPSRPTDSPEDLARRDQAAIARIAALCPANAAEADIAAAYVAASEQWKECLRLAQQPEMSLLGAIKCRAQANSMMRQSQSALRLLLRMQAARQKTEANHETRDRAAWAEHCALNLLAEALSEQTAPTPIPQPPAPPPPAPFQPNKHLSHPPAELDLRTEPPHGASRPQESQPATNSAQPNGTPVEQSQPTLAVAQPNSAISPHSAAMVRLLKRLPSPPGYDLRQALVTALTTAPATPDHQSAKATAA